MRKLITVIVLVLAIAAAVLAPFVDIDRPSRPQGMNRFLFFPAKYPIGNWKPQKLTFVDTYFRAEDGTQLHGWHCPCDEPIAHVLILHGNAGNVSVHVSNLQFLQQSNISSFIFDYRGFGRSSGSPTVQGAMKDSEAALQQFCKLDRLLPTEMMLLGESLGGAYAVALGVDTSPAGIILLNTFSSLRDMAEVHHPDRATMVPGDLLDSVHRIGSYHGPLLQSHVEKDQTVPFSLGARLYSAANEPKEFVSIPNSDHGGTWGDSFKSKLLHFIKRNANPHGRSTRFRSMNTSANAQTTF